MKKIALALAALALVTGCPPPAPLISLFTVAPNDIAAGSKATLVYIAVEGTTLTIDNGVGDVTGTTQIDVTPDATTTYTLTATKDGKSASASVTVNVTGVQPPSLITLFTAAPAAISAGSSTTLVFTSVPGATLSLDNGIGDVTGRTQVDVTPAADTTYTLTAARDGRTATAAVTVTVGGTPAVGFAVTGFTSATAGVPGTVTITAVNAGGAPIATYRGTVHFTSDDAQATLPSDVTFTAGDSGRKTVDVTFRTAGARLLIAGDTASSSAQGFGRIVVGPGPTDALAISAATTSVVAGDGVAITVTARDAYGNQATGYGGSLQIAVADPLASAPGTVSFGPGDQGRKTFGVSFGQAGSWTVTATDTVNGTLTASTASIAVGPAAPSVLALAGGGAATAGVASSVTLAVRDRFGNAVTGFTGTVSFTSSDPGATVPAPYTFVPGDNGAHQFDVTFTTAGTQQVSVGSGGLGATGYFTISPAAPSALAISSNSAGVTAGDGVAITLTARDAFGNQATSYGGSIQVATLDPLATTPGTVSFGPGDQGRKTFGVSFGQAGSWTVTATDTANGSLTATTSSIAVVPAAASVFALAGGGAATAGASSSVTLTARDRFGNAAAGFTGTVSFTSSDPGATVPAPYTFVPSDNGSHQFSVTFVTAGAQQLNTGSGSLGATGHYIISPAPASVLAISAGGASAAAGDSVSITVTARDPFGNQATGYGGAVQVSTLDPLATTPGTVSFGPGDQGRKTFSVSFGMAGSWAVTATDTANGSLTAVTPPIAVGPGAIDHFVLAGPPDVAVDAPAAFTATVQDRFGNVLTGYPGTIHVTHDDPTAPAVPDAGFANGVATFNVTFFTAGDRSVIVTPASGGGQGGTLFITVRPGVATHYGLSALPGSAQAGDPLALTITALDVRNNVVRNYSQLARVTSTDATDQLPPDTGFNLGVATVSLAFVRSGSHFVTVSEVGGTITAGSTTTSVSPAAASELALTGGGATVAGAPGSFTITARDRFGNVATGFTGTVSFSSTDPGATVPASYTFVAGDAGTHAFTATFRTAGAQQLTAAATGFSVVGHYAVSPAAASQCALTGLAAIAVAGAQLVPVVTFRDPFSNVATGYTGVVTLTTTASSAVLPPPAAIGPGDGGSHAFLAQILSAGTASVTASDGAINCSADVTVSPAAPRYVVTFAGDVNASWTSSGTVAVRDIFNNPFPNYAGVLHFTSTDAAGVPPADITLNGSEGGVAAFSFLFNSAGLQTLTVSDPASIVATGVASVRVHGLAYTSPTPGAGKMRVVLNAAASTSSTVQLDVVSNTFTARVTNGTYIRGGVFSTGMNLPLNANRVVAGTPLLTEPATLIIPTGAAPKAVAATLATSGPAAGQLLVALSGKRVGAGGTINDNGMVVGSVVYSLRLRIAQNATAGTVFDGNSLPATFRATIRSINGDDIVGQEGFALGKLEVL